MVDAAGNAGDLKNFQVCSTNREFGTVLDHTHFLA